MSLSKRITVGVIFVVMSLLLLAGCRPAVEEQAEAQPARAGDDGIVKLGFVADVSGVGYLFAQSQLAGLRIAIDEINADGGILGRQVDYVMRDAQLKPDIGATLARQMILEDKVDFLLGPTSSSVALAVSEVAREYKVVVAFHTSNSVEITTSKGHPYLLQVVPNTTIEARAVAQFVSDMPYQTWAVIAPDYSFGHDAFGAFQPRQQLLNQSARVANEQWPALGERDLTSFITAMQASRPEAVYSILWGDQLVTMVQQALPLGLLDDAAFVGLFDTDFMKAIGKELPEGLLGYARAPFYAIDTPQMESFITKHQALTKTYPSDWAIMTYDAVYALKAAAEAAGSTDGDAVAKALDDLTFQSLRGPLTIRACDHMANVGEYVGTTSHSPDYPFPILTDVTHIPAEILWDSCDEVAAMRASSR
jgi:branched-chain amino acid transport system substrate-binding protein